MSHSAYRRIAVIDIGKTNAKVVVVDATDGREIAAVRTANTVLPAPPFPHFDTAALWTFISDALRNFAVQPGFDAISITTHGACAALVDADGELALPVLDYEYEYPQPVREAYAVLRPDFSETYSPRLAAGLNLGAQIHFLKTAFPEDFARVRKIMTWPQYWAFRLTGIATNEATSLGCHTDLWQPANGQYSSLVDRLDIGALMAPVHPASGMLGPVHADTAREIGLTSPVPVFCGIHDSNASLLPHLARRNAPFAVVSTGTWVVSFAVGGDLAGLDAGRDTLANVDAYGRAVASARYMGGREFDMLTTGMPAPSEAAVEAAIAGVIGRDLMVLPNIAHGSGPLPGREGGWQGTAENAAQAHVAASLYTAMMSALCLEIIGAAGPAVVEGPFAKNRVWLAAMGELTGREVVALPDSTGTSVGAAMLTGATFPPPQPAQYALPALPGFLAYAGKWRRQL